MNKLDVGFSDSPCKTADGYAADIEINKRKLQKFLKHCFAYRHRDKLTVTDLDFETCLHDELVVPLIFNMRLWANIHTELWDTSIVAQG